LASVPTARSAKAARAPRISPAPPKPRARAEKPRVAVNAASADYGRLPISFEANRGQTDAHALFLARGAGYALFLAETEAVLSLRGRASDASAALHLQWLGANTAPRVAGLEQQTGRSNYFIGGDPARWRTDIPNYTRVRYENLYDGIDLVYYGNHEQLEYDLVVAPGGDVAPARLNVAGARAVRLARNGDLVLQLAGGEMRWLRPVAYQEVNGARTAVPARYVLKGGAVGFAVAAYDARLPLVIDPVLNYSTYLGGAAADEGHAIAVDQNGNAYVAGYTESLNFPGTSSLPCQSVSDPKNPCGGRDAFVAKLDATGGALVYATYIGGGGADEARGIAVGPLGDVYLTGKAGAAGNEFPRTPSAAQAIYGGGASDAFVLQLNASGNALVYATYLGGLGNDEANGLALDANGSVYVAGTGGAAVTPGTFNTLPNGGAFVAKFAAGGALVYNSDFGGFNADSGAAVAVDAAGDAYVVGATLSPNFPTTPGAFQTTHHGSNDAYVLKLNAAGTALVYATMLGGTSNDVGTSIAVDAGGRAYVGGALSAVTAPGGDFPATAGAFQEMVQGSNDGFVSVLNPGGSALDYSTYLGGAGSDGINALALDAAGIVHVAGVTGSTNFPTTTAALDTSLGGSQDAFVARLRPDGTDADAGPNDPSDLLFATYLGGGGAEIAFALAADAGGSSYVTGLTQSFASAPFPLAHPLQATNGGIRDAFVSKIGGSDRDAPTTVATTAPQANAAGWYNADVNVSLDATDNAGGSGVRDITYSASGAQTSPQTVVSGAHASITLNVEGETTLAFYATDNAGNVEAAQALLVRIDRSAPVVTCGGTDGAWHASDVSIGCTAADNVSGLDNAADASFTLTTSVPAGTEDADAATGSRAVCDAAGNCVTTGPVASNKIDKKAPSVNCGSADGAWHANDVSIPCTSSDGGSGLANASDAGLALTTSVPNGTETANAATNSRNVADVVGNTTTVGPVAGNMVDKKGPSVTISVPVNGGSYQLNQAVAASYACADGGSGVASCTGTVPSGGALDTASVGVKTFTVHATDQTGHTTTQSVTYSVGYDVCLLYDETKAHKSGSTIPIKLQLCAGGANISSPAIVVTALGTIRLSDYAPGEVEDAGQANPDDNFRYTGGSYMFNLKTTGLSTGTYALSFRVGADPRTHAATFQIK
jgi:hypothetical protein